MKAASFRYHRPLTTAAAVELLGEYGESGKPLAGGQSLVPLLALRLTRFEHLIDLNRIPELQGVRPADREVSVGSMTRQSAVETDETLAASVPLLVRATPLIGHFQIRNRGTVGGSLAHADPASEYPAVALALDARLEIEGQHGRRTVPAADFFRTTWTTALASDELLDRVIFPVWEGRCGFAIEEVARRYGDFAIVGAVCAVEAVDDGRVVRVGLAMFGVGDTPVRLRSGEAALLSAGPDQLGEGPLRDLCRQAVEELDPPGDVHASKSYRKRVAAVVLGRALGRALLEAWGDG